MFKRIVLNNGVRIAYEKVPYVRSVSVGIWICTGSRNESKSNNGVSHFVEHMLFKGTEKRSARKIAESIDNIGGQINAFTGKEYTCFYTKTLDTHIGIAMDILADMFFNSKFAQKDIDIEKKVILEEIGMCEDSPEELAHDILSEIVWDGNPLGYPILGTLECLDNMDRSVILQYMRQNYTPGNTVISVAGNFDEKELLESADKYFGSWQCASEERYGQNRAEFITDFKLKEKDTEQVHVCMGFNGLEHGHDDIYTLLAINNIFGGGMSSRLFQKVREEMGLAYSIYSYPSSYKNAGLYTIYAGMNPEQLVKVVDLIIKEIKDLFAIGISVDDLCKSKEQLKGSYILSLESTSNRMNSIGKSELMLELIHTPEEILDRIDKIEMGNVVDVINKIFDIKKMSISVVGNMKKDTDFKEIMNRCQ